MYSRRTKTLEAEVLTDRSQEVTGDPVGWQACSLRIPYLGSSITSDFCLETTSFGFLELNYPTKTRTTPHINFYCSY